MEYSPFLCFNGYRELKCQKCIILAGNHNNQQEWTHYSSIKTAIRGFVCFVLWREGSSGLDAWFSLICVRACGLSTSCVQTTYTLCLCLGALVGAGGSEREGWGCGSAVPKASSLHATVTFAFDMWRPWAHPSSPPTTQLLVLAWEGRQIWCRLGALKTSLSGEDS